MKNNQKGFSVVEALLIVFLVGMIGAVGWYVYGIQKQPKASLKETSQTNIAKVKPVVEDKVPNATALATLLTSHNKKFSISLPNGWIVTNDTELDYVHAIGLENMTYIEGKPAKIIDQLGHRGGGPTVANFVIQYGDTSTLGGYFNSSEDQGSFKTNAGLEGKKFLYVAKEGPDSMLTNGGKAYGYKFTDGNKVIVISYVKLPSDPDQLKVEEDAVSTLKFL